MRRGLHDRPRAPYDGAGVRVTDHFSSNLLSAEQNPTDCWRTSDSADCGLLKGCLAALVRQPLDSLLFILGQSICNSTVDDVILFVL